MYVKQQSKQTKAESKKKLRTIWWSDYGQKSGLFHRVGGDQSTTLNVIYQNVCHSLKFMNLPGYSGYCWCELRNPRWRPRWPPEINKIGCGI